MVRYVAPDVPKIRRFSFRGAHRIESVDSSNAPDARERRILWSVAATVPAV